MSPRKWKKAFVFFKHEDGAAGTEFAVRLRGLVTPAVRDRREDTAVSF
jgi:hypothetical protein